MNAKLIPIPGFKIPSVGPDLDRVNLMIFNGELVRHPGGTFSRRVFVTSTEEVGSVSVPIGPRLMNPGPVRSVRHSIHDRSNTDPRRNNHRRF